MAPYVVLDSGERQEFPTGCHRDAQGGKGRFDLLPPAALARDALLYERGAVKYDARNWEKGMPFSRCIDSALRHLNKYMDGDRVEDHLAAARFNIACLMHYEEMIERGLLPAGLNDLPTYTPKPAAEPAISDAVCADCNRPLGGQGARNPCDCAFWLRGDSPSPDKETPDAPPPPGS
jgi:hypothetical protein